MKKIVLSCLLIFGLAACTSNPVQTKAINSEDPYENYNRKIYNFNMKFDEYVGQPAGKAYTAVTPRPVRTGISNFFSNLRTPVNMINNFLQGKVEAGLSDIMRFSLNTVFGFGGILDIATPAGLVQEREDFGQTLHKWGVWKESNFFVLPILGATTPRELTGGVTDAAWNPTYHYVIKTDLEGRTILYLANAFNSYTEIMELTETLKNAPDPYVFYRESYIQYRNNLLYDGNPPLDNYDDFDFD